MDSILKNREKASKIANCSKKFELELEFFWKSIDTSGLEKKLQQLPLFQDRLLLLFIQYKISEQRCFDTSSLRLQLAEH